MTQDEVMAAAAHLRSLHKVHGLIVISLEPNSCQFGFSLAVGDEQTLLRAMPRVLREMADKIETQGSDLIIQLDKGQSLA